MFSWVEQEKMFLTSGQDSYGGCLYTIKIRFSAKDDKT